MQLQLLDILVSLSIPAGKCDKYCNFIHTINILSIFDFSNIDPERCKMTIDCVTCTRVQVQLMILFPWTPVCHAGNGHVKSINNYVLIHPWNYTWLPTRDGPSSVFTYYSLCCCTCTVYTIAACSHESPLALESLFNTLLESQFASILGKAVLREPHCESYVERPTSDEPHWESIIERAVLI